MHVLSCNSLTSSYTHTGPTQCRRAAVKEHDHHWDSQQDCIQLKNLITLIKHNLNTSVLIDMVTEPIKRVSIQPTMCNVACSRAIVH
jgi:hypothetical protein